MWINRDGWTWGIVKKLLRYIPLMVVGLFGIISFIVGVNQFNEIDSFFSDKAFSNKEKIGETNIDVGDMQVVNTQVQRSGTTESKEWEMYVSLFNVNHQVASTKVDSILSQENTDHAFYSIESHPSFIVGQEDLSSWRFYFQLNNIFTWGGYFLICVFLFLFHERTTRDGFKKGDSIKTIRNIAVIFGSICMYGFMIKYGINYYFSEFLQEQYAYNTSIPSPDYLVTMGIPIVLLIPYLAHAVHLQKEQDLTI